VVIPDASSTWDRDAPAVDVMTASVGDPAQLLVVLVEQRPRVAGLVADRRTGEPVGVPEPAEAPPGEHPVHGRAGHAQQRAQAVRAIAGRRTKPHDLLLDARVQTAWRAMRSGAAVLETRGSFGTIAPEPLVAGGPADAELARDRGHRLAQALHPAHQQLSPEDVETRPMLRHERLLSVWLLDTPHLAARLSSVNNVWVHHS
jgi:hypothetical protein